MIDTVWKGGERHSGHGLALVSTILLVVDGILMVGATVMALNFMASSPHPLADLFSRSWFPLGLYVIWGLGVFGTAGAISAIALYGFRERWFWRWLVVVSVTWLISPPAHTVIGLISLIVLLSTRSKFPKHQTPTEPPP